ncbi:MAG: single-stranded-DNA-specific exonuclease RecJ [Planctomycetota bacterium]
MQTAKRPTQWRRRSNNSPQQECITRLGQTVGVSPLVAELLWQRGFEDQEAAGRFLRPKLTHLQDPASLPGCADAAETLADAIHQRQPIVIYGDYDVDGITASAILYHTLVALHQYLHGTRPDQAPVATYVPHRVEEGYGLNTEALDAIAAYLPCPSLKPDTPAGETVPPPLVVTVDCGITAVDCAAHARAIGLTLIITDHHVIPEGERPDATLVHPDLDGDSVLGRDAAPCGAGVAFQVAWQTARAALSTDKLPRDLQALMLELISLAALGTIADMVELRGSNRVITAVGLGRMKRTRFDGLNALIAAAGLADTDENVDAYKVGFVLGPRLNACGRMGHARQAVELLTTATGPRADALAAFLTEQNDARRTEERKVFEQAAKRVEAEGHAADDRRVIVLDDPAWHPGVVGIVASRLVERFHRPAVLLYHMAEEQQGEHGHRLKGSARSVRGVHIQEAFAACAEHLDQFGGHAMAAGLSLRADRFDAFRSALVERVNQHLRVEDLIPSLRYDLEVTEQDLDPSVFADVQQLAPFGMSHPAPRFLLAGGIITRPPRRVGKAAAHLTLEIKVGQRALRGIAFGRGEDGDSLGVGDRLDLVFEPKLNTWNGVTRAEMMILDFRQAD